MTWREKLVVRVLMVVAYIIADGPLRTEVKHLSNHISQHSGD